MAKKLQILGVLDIGDEDCNDSLNLLIETDMLPAVHDIDDKILTDENGNVILRY